MKILKIQRDYAVCRAGRTEKLIQHVIAAMADGWRPVGGIAVLEYGGKETYKQEYAQALTRTRWRWFVG